MFEVNSWRAIFHCARGIDGFGRFSTEVSVAACPELKHDALLILAEHFHNADRMQRTPGYNHDVQVGGGNG